MDRYYLTPGEPRLEDMIWPNFEKLLQSLGKFIGEEIGLEKEELNR
mgnify:CR=1 FL=1